MKVQFEYRAYTVLADGGRYIALSVDDDFRIESTYLVSVLRGIDAIWDALIAIDTRSSLDFLPLWTREWLDDPSKDYIDVDLANGGAAPPDRLATVHKFPAQHTSVPMTGLCVLK